MVTRRSSGIEERLASLRGDVKQLLAEVDERQREAAQARTPAEAELKKHFAKGLLRRARSKVAQMDRLVKRL